LKKWIRTLLTALIILLFSSTFHALPATADNSLGAPVTIILSGTIQDGNVTSGVIHVNSGFVVIGGYTNVVCQCIPPGFNGSDLDCVYTSTTDEGNVNATIISLGGGKLILRLAGLFTPVNNELLAVVFGVGTPFPGSTSMTEGYGGPVVTLIDAKGTIHVDGTSVEIDATGTVTSGPTLSLYTYPCKTVIGKGYNLPLNLTITNAGYLSQIPHIIIYANTTIIGTETNINLTNGTPTTFSLTYNTDSLSLGNYSLATFPSGPATFYPIVLTIPGDIDGNFQVQLADLVILARTYGSKPNDAKWNADADIDSNSAVGLPDLVILANHYGEHHP
jgi:hypothetical protein